MKKANIAGIPWRWVLEKRQMPPQLLDGLCASLGGDPGGFTACMEKDFGDFDPGDKEAFCAWLHEQCFGSTPAEHSSRPAGEQRRIVHDHPDCPGGWALISLSTGRLLGCHATEAEALAQEAAIKAQQAEQKSLPIEELQAALPAVERRFLPAQAELRAEDGPVVELRIPYDQESENLGGFREVIRRTAFQKTIQERDIVSLWNHDANWVLGRRSNGTLAIESRDDQLVARVRLDPQDPMHRHFARRLERRDVTGASFGFEKVRDRWEAASSDGVPLRELLEVKLYDISPVTFPAYPGSQSAQRGLTVEDIGAVVAGVDVRELASMLSRVKDGRLVETDVERFRSCLAALEGLLPPAAAKPAGVSDADRLRRLAVRERLVRVLATNR